MKQGLLLINLGTPSSTKLRHIWAFLSEFLLDRRVINLPVVLRCLLVYGIILPFRTGKSAHAYRSIWTEQGSPLLFNNQNLKSQLEKRLPSNCIIALGMRYGNPSLKQSINDLQECETLTLLPLYPQYSSAATGSAIEKALQCLAPLESLPSIQVIRAFYQHPSYIKAQATVIKMHLKPGSHLLFSYHGIPVQQLIQGGCDKPCPEICSVPKEKLHSCYKAQCYSTSLLLAQELQLDSDQYSTSFQSRLGKLPWISPYTDQMLEGLIALGIKDLTVACPSFVSDCLETLEEIGIRARAKWLSLGGERFTLIPALNDHPLWVEAVLDIAGIAN